MTKVIRNIISLTHTNTEILLTWKIEDTDLLQTKIPTLL